MISGFQNRADLKQCEFLIRSLAGVLWIGHIKGLPNTVQAKGNIVIFRVTEGTQFHLQCVCPLHTPVWNISYLKDWRHQRIPGPVWCSNNSKTCDPPDRSFIRDPLAGLNTIINLTIVIDQTMVLKCYRTSHSSNNPDQLLMVDVGEEMMCAICITHEKHNDLNDTEN